MSLFTSFGGGDIWSGGFAFASPINDILERDSFTLGELLEEDEVLQEVKSLNTRLLLSYLVDPIPAKSSDSRRFKSPYMSCEILCCEVPALLNALTDDATPQHMDKLFSLLSQKQNSLDNHQAGYFEKVFMVLLKHRCPALVAYVNNAGMPLFSKFMTHMANFSVMQVARRLLLPKYASLQDNIEVINMLVKALQTSADQTEEQADAASHQAELCLSLISHCEHSSVFLSGMYQASVLQALSDAVHTTSTSQTTTTATDNHTVASSAYATETTLAAMKVLEALLYRLTPQPPLSLFPGAPTSNTHTPRATNTNYASAKTPQQNDATDSNTADENKEQQQQQQTDDDDTVMKEQPQQSGASSCSDSVDHAVVIACIEQLLPKLYTILQCDTGTVVTCTKETVHRVGAVRLQAARLIQVMVQLDWSEVDSAVVKCSAMNQLLELFFKHEHCSLLHQIVSGAIISAIETDTHDLTDGRKALQKHIITDCRLLERLRGAVAGNSVGEAHGIKRRGYMGHVIRVSDALDIAENGGEWHSLNTIACPVNNNNINTSNSNTTDTTARETERDATYLHAVMKTDACFEWWSDFVDTTLEQATQLQNTPLGNFDVPTRDEETTDDDMMLTMDDSMSAMLDQLTHNNSSTAIEGTVGSDTHDTDDVDPTTVWGRAVGGFSSETVSSPQNSFMVNNSSSNMHNADTDHDIGTNNNTTSGGGDNSGWANFADFGQQPFQTTQLQTAPVVEGFANFDANFDAAFGNQSATTSDTTAAFANTTATATTASHLQQQQLFDSSIDSAFEADFSQFMAPPSEHAPVITHATAVHNSNSSTNSSCKSSASDEDEQSDVSSSSNDDTDDSNDDGNSATNTTGHQQQQYAEQLNEDEHQPHSNDNHHDKDTVTGTSATTTDAT
eukprot:20474-Heterococcus_DN1.PRE.2